MANKKVWKFYLDGKEVKRWRAINAVNTNEHFYDLIKEYPDDELVPLWKSRIRNVDIRKEYQY